MVRGPEKSGQGLRQEPGAKNWSRSREGRHLLEVEGTPLLLSYTIQATRVGPTTVSWVLPHLPSNQEVHHRLYPQVILVGTFSQLRNKVFQNDCSLCQTDTKLPSKPHLLGCVVSNALNSRLSN